MERLEELRARERNLKETQRQQQKDYTTAQDNADGFNGLEDDIQNKRAQLDQLKQQRDEQQHIYDEAKDILEKRQKQLEELNKLINEAEARESASSATPAISGNDVTPLPEQGSEESPIVQRVEQQCENLQNEEQQLTEKLAQVTDEKTAIEKIVREIEDIINTDASA